VLEHLRHNAAVLWSQHHPLNRHYCPCHRNDGWDGGPDTERRL